MPQSCIGEEIRSIVIKNEENQGRGKRIVASPFKLLSWIFVSDIMVPMIIDVFER